MNHTQTAIALSLSLSFALLAFACADDSSPLVPGGTDGTVDAAAGLDDVNDASADEGAQRDTVEQHDTDGNADTGTGPEVEPTDDAGPGADTSADAVGDIARDVGGSNALLVQCEGLSYELTCDDTAVRTGGYFACSDYFGDTTGVEVQCEVQPTVDVRVGGPPCRRYEHFVGSCVYFSEALPDRCYVTHVGAESADLVEAGREFWRATCAGEWLE